MNKNYRDLDKLRSNRSSAIRKKRKKYGKPARKNAMAMVMIDHYQNQDREASDQYAREQELKKISMRMFGKDTTFDDLTPEQVKEVAEELGASSFTSELIDADSSGA